MGHESRYKMVAARQHRGRAGVCVRYPVMRLTMRTYETEDDYWRIRDFLRAVFLLNGRRDLSRQAYRFNYWRWHVLENFAWRRSSPRGRPRTGGSLPY
jgi:hypothetical protein